jgi:hypothetical protein
MPTGFSNHEDVLGNARTEGLMLNIIEYTLCFFNPQKKGNALSQLKSLTLNPGTKIDSPINSLRSSLTTMPGNKEAS